MKNGPYVLIVAPSNYPGKLYRKKYCYEHHYIYWLYTGVVPIKGEVIHHKDGNRTNNEIDNLILLSNYAHSIFHKRKLKTYSYCCLTCGKTGEHRNRYRKFCSRRCIGLYNFRGRF